MRKLMFLPLAAFLMIGCSETPQTAVKKEPPKPPEPVTGQTALFRMYQAARTWAPDAQVLKMSSVLLDEVPNVPRGKAAAWQATFVSSERSQAKSYTYSVIESLPTWHKGVFAGLDESWSGPHGVNSPFLMAAVSKDTPLAYETALAQAGDYDKKNPGKPITFLLEKVTKFPDPVWRVVWGESVGTSNFSIYVDASTGDYKEKLR
jgi:hypothetical protein